MKPDRFEYMPITDRPVLRWPNGARVALWVVPNVEHYEYLPPDNKVRDPWPRTPHPDTMNYAYRDYGNRVGFWRMLEAMDKHQIRGTVSLNVAVLDHFPDIREAMVARDWDYMSHGIYNTRFLSGLSAAEERAVHKNVIETIRKHTGKRVKGILGPAITNTERTSDLLAEMGFIYQVDWVCDDQPFPLKVKKGKLIAIPYTLELNDVAMRSQGHEADYFEQIIKDQFDRLYAEGERNARSMCIAIHPYWIGHPHRTKHLDHALSYILSHPGVWTTTADEIAEYYMKNYYDKVVSYLEKRGASDPQRGARP